ncbi:hypothetical protein FD754_006943 [Muntiacus muntjak]|uniref:SHC-transforming protein 2 n=1 Tax=Muntiacus muntjak TaxID=9888 RepID=A0A5N3WPE8_MUNMU|nr:hypothetical protein FD754_006943 [Muntiacus muntjak]
MPGAPQLLEHTPAMLQAAPQFVSALNGAHDARGPAQRVRFQRGAWRRTLSPMQLLGTGLLGVRVVLCTVLGLPCWHPSSPSRQSPECFLSWFWRSKPYPPASMVGWYHQLDGHDWWLFLHLCALSWPPCPHKRHSLKIFAYKYVKILFPFTTSMVQYMGCIEVLRSMRSLDFSTRTQVTREAINRLHEAVPGVRGSWKKKAPNKALASILGKSNLRFAGMSIAVSISIDGLNLSVPATRQIIANHHMQSISFASGGDTDMADYVAYVAKDPINQRACHILECCEGLAQSVISTVGQAFELRFKQYLHSPPRVVVPPERLTGMEDSAWGDEEEAEHNYYNSLPGKEPPPGGLVDSRLALTQPCALGVLGTLGQGASPARRDARGLQWDVGPSAQPGDGYVQADPRGPRDYEDHLYVNTQGLDGPEPLRPEDSPKKDLFDMRPFEDALRLHECSVAAGSVAAPLPVEDQWPSPPTRRAPIAPTEEQLRQEPWYHGQMSRRAAEKLLRADGDFLVRDSVTNPGQYVLTGMHAGQPKHLLLVDPEGVVRTKDVLFESISHLIDYHLQNGQPIVAAESELHLRGVVKREP